MQHKLKKGFNVDRIASKFSARLKEGLIKRGFCSNTSKIGVQAAPLAGYLGSSVQMVRKYLTAESCPDLETIIKISAFLNVSPCWLAFGQEEPKQKITIRNFEIKKKFVRAIFEGLFVNAFEIPFENDQLEAVCNFLYGIINDIAQLESDDEMKLRLIKTSISSACIARKQTWKQLTEQV